MSDFILKAYKVTVEGFPPVQYYAKSHGKARAKAWRDFQSVCQDCTFKDFMSLASVSRSTFTPNNFGSEIKVGGNRAFYVKHAGGNSIAFVLPDSDNILLSHEIDVVWPEGKPAP